VGGGGEGGGGGQGCRASCHVQAGSKHREAVIWIQIRIESAFLESLNRDPKFFLTSKEKYRKKSSPGSGFGPA